MHSWVCTNIHSKATYLLGVHQFITQKVGKGGKRMNEFSLITQNPILSTHKHVYSKATYPLRVHQFTTQVDNRYKRRNEFSLIPKNPIMHMHKNVHSKATYLLRVYQFTTRKWVRR